MLRRYPGVGQRVSEAGAGSNPIIAKVSREVSGMRLAGIPE
jgi:hypothetical protein